VNRQLETLPTAGVAQQSIEGNGAIVVLDSLERAVEISNALAPEHLALHDEACSLRSGTPVRCLWARAARNAR